MPIIPRPLLPGSTVVMLAPASSPDAEDLEGAVRDAAARLSAAGFRVRIDPTCSMRDGYLAGPDQARADALNRAFADDTVDGIFCIRGGFGAIHLPELLDLAMIRQHPKALIGYSDITVLHALLREKCDLCTFHGPMPGSEGFAAGQNLDSLLHALAGTPDDTLVNPDGTPLTALRCGIAEGELTGGNLCLTASIAGTPWAHDTRGRLLFLEDVGETVYTMDRYLHTLYLTGALKHCAGVIFGRFTAVKEEGHTLTMDEVLARMAEKLSVPVVKGLQVGHITESLTLPFGRRYRLDADHGTITRIS